MNQFPPVSLRRREATKELYDKAKEGDREAGEEMIRLNRKGGLQVHQARITKATIKKMLDRRDKRRSSSPVRSVGATVLG